MELLSSYGTVSQPYWPDDVWIVAGGPSARAFDFSRLRDQFVLSVNEHAFTLLRDRSDAIFSLDKNWVRRYRESLEVFPGEKFLAISLEAWPDCSGISGAIYLKQSSAPGLSDDPGIINTGCNSGYGAIGLAYHKRASRIHLVGYDMDPEAYHQFVYWAPLFRGMQAQLAARGIEVLNHNKDSFIDAFPKVDVK